jgi:hypothetical protein
MIVRYQDLSEMILMVDEFDSIESGCLKHGKTNRVKCNALNLVLELNL